MKKFGVWWVSGIVGGGNEDDEDGEGWEMDSLVFFFDLVDLIVVLVEGYFY